jgi:hypothetical protein
MTNPTPPPNPNDPNPGGPTTPYRGLSQDRRITTYHAQNGYRELLTPRQAARVAKKERRLERVTR